MTEDELQERISRLELLVEALVLDRRGWSTEDRRERMLEAQSIIYDDYYLSKIGNLRAEWHKARQARQDENNE